MRLEALWGGGVESTRSSIVNLHANHLKTVSKKLRPCGLVVNRPHVNRFSKICVSSRPGVAANLFAGNRGEILRSTTCIAVSSQKRI